MIHQIMRQAAVAVTNRKGVTAAEYAILAVGIAVTIGAAGATLRAPLLNALSSVGLQITSQQSAFTN